MFVILLILNLGMIRGQQLDHQNGFPLPPQHNLRHPLHFHGPEGLGRFADPNALPGEDYSHLAFPGSASNQFSNLKNNRGANDDVISAEALENELNRGVRKHLATDEKPDHSILESNEESTQDAKDSSSSKDEAIELDHEDSVPLSSFVTPPPLTNEQLKIISAKQSDFDNPPEDDLSKRLTLSDNLEIAPGPFNASKGYDFKNSEFNDNLENNSDGKRVLDTKIDCEKDSMTVTFKFSFPFNGVIYPYGSFDKCILFSGQNHYSAVLTLKHGQCGQHIGNGIDGSGPIFEHHLMIQWEPEFVSEDDSSVIVRCDRPDTYNKTISWNLGTGDVRETVESSSHGGPQMWMDIELGQGPRAPSLESSVVRVGDVLTIVFTLADEVYWFDANILTCHVFDGTGEKKLITWEDSRTTRPRHSYSGQMLVVEEGCSTKPKLFSNFYKFRETSPAGVKTSLHYAYFKAFRFPTSPEIQIECDVEVCYKNCQQLPKCGSGFDPQTRHSRTRRSAEDPDNPESAHELDRVNFKKTIKVRMKEGVSDDDIPPVTKGRSDSEDLVCYPSNVFLGTVVTLGTCVAILSLLLIVCSFRSNNVRPVFFTPRKQ